MELEGVTEVRPVDDDHEYYFNASHLYQAIFIQASQRRTSGTVVLMMR